MKKLITTLLAVAILATPSAVAAETLPLSARFNFLSTQLIDKPATQTIVIPVTPKETKPAAVPKNPEPVIYIVVNGDNLSKIGTAHNVQWQRLWAKNIQLTNPDLIHLGDKITIPEPSEQLTRDLPAVVALPAITPGVVAAKPVYDGSNTYDYGYCTWYVKNRRGASIPNSLGNANTWYSRAAGAGMALGSEPRAGAIGTTTRGSLGHVVYVESVNDDGTVNISEMNYAGFGVQSSRTTNASEFVYIY